MDSESFIPNSVAKVYYDDFFPFDDFWSLFSNGQPNDICMTNREFSFRKQGYVNRYLSYDNVSQLRKDLLLHTPFRFELGAVYNARTADHIKLGKTFFDLEKELVFDIDLSDYNDVRTCCEGAQICEKCWPLMHIAHDIITDVLETDFGYKKIMWVTTMLNYFKGSKGNRDIQFELEKYKLFCCYPRLDENVSSDRKHLLKAVFSVHPSTGLICVPINKDAFKQFKPWRCRISVPPQQEEPIMSKEGPKLSAVERLKLARKKKEEAVAADQPNEAPKEGTKMLLDVEEDEDEREMQKEEEKPVNNSTKNVEQSEVIDLEKEETVNAILDQFNPNARKGSMKQPSK
ncbi:putative DNA primase small subunit [Blattamonas nauphoetae]|uniref:DNA primase n=1 Tax=Blattamonas nauphoetae TaxID=2049346 RepID=A0ABQ9WV12_9EUKA|nr:putative DNA primase small subunit [Blattamonas nauphoetae]